MKYEVLGINILKLPRQLRQRVRKKLTLIVQLAIVCYALTIFLFNIFELQVIAEVYGWWGCIGVVLTSTHSSQQRIIIYTLPLMMWACAIVYCIALYYVIRPQQTYTPKEFFYTKKFEDYKN